MNTKLIGAIILSLIVICVGYSFLTQEDKLIVKVAGNTVGDTLFPAIVTGHIEDIDYNSKRDAFVLLPGQKVMMNVYVYNEQNNDNWYKVWVYDDSRIIWTSMDQYLKPGNDKEWKFTYTAQQNEGKTTIYVESGRSPSSDFPPWTHEFPGWKYDDIQDFDIIIEEDGPIDPCLGVTCDNYCTGTTYHYNGYCVNGDCKYTSGEVDGKCGFIEDPCLGVTCDNYCTGETFNYAGICVNGECQYTSGLVNGKCGYIEDLCEGVTCNPYCTDTTYYYNGECVNGVCQYASGEVDGKCGYTDPTDPCIGVTCDSYCDGTTYHYNGECNNGDCKYTSGEVDGKCGFIEDPCLGVTCDNYCDGEYYNYNGVCVDGECEFAVAKVDEQCGYTDNTCEGITCPDICAEPNTFKHGGVCVNGECEYIEDANSPECNYVAPVSGGGGGGSSSITRPTATPVPADDTEPSTDEPSDIPYTTITIVLFVLAIGGYLYANREIFK
ncbi:MAG: hypothetical protein KAS32_31485 [Candidatus Peribacteraceae bacterium]|nr:hypothetical protein [Candidatus Peribacteraceae bacterium]